MHVKRSLFVLLVLSQAIRGDEQASGATPRQNVYHSRSPQVSGSARPLILESSNALSADLFIGVVWFYLSRSYSRSRR